MWQTWRRQLVVSLPVIIGKKAVKLDWHSFSK
jgi:hypothetical protein